MNADKRNFKKLSAYINSMGNEIENDLSVIENKLLFETNKETRRQLLNTQSKLKAQQIKNISKQYNIISLFPSLENSEDAKQNRREQYIIDQRNGDVSGGFGKKVKKGDPMSFVYTFPPKDFRCRMEVAACFCFAGDKFLLLQTVFRHLQGLWEVAPRGAVIEITTAERGEEVVVRLAGPAPTLVDEDSDRLTLLAELEERLGATVGCESAGDRQIVSIAVPGGPS